MALDSISEKLRSLLSKIGNWWRPDRSQKPAAEQQKVLQAEEELIRECAPGQYEKEGGFLGLALSGGGIRSATFNLGVLQALSERKLLRRTDYLSTVSGGGYIGSWLSALIRRHKGKIEDVEQDLDPHEQWRRGGREPDAVEFLRRFSNYLTPQTGLFSTDTLSGVATYVRNVLLMQSTIVGAFVLALLLPRLLPWLANTCVFQSPWLCIFALFIAAIFIDLNLSLPPVDDKRSPRPWYARQTFVLWLIVVPLMLAAWMVSVLLYAHGTDSDRIPLLKDVELGTWAIYFEFMLTIGAVWVLAWLFVSFAIVRRRPEGHRKISGRSWGVLAFITLAFGVELLCLILEKLQAHAGPSLIWHWTVWSVPVLLTVFGLSAVLLIGLVGRAFEEDEREWWSRLGAWLIAGGVGWFVICAAAIYGPFVIMLTEGWLKSLSLAWVVSTVGGVVLGKSKATGGLHSSKWLDLVAEATPYIFVAGLLLLLSYGIDCALTAWFGAGNGIMVSAQRLAMSPPTFSQYAQVLNNVLGTRPSTWWPLVLLLVAMLLLIWRLDINVFSFHMFYRNRLVRAYLGASNPERNPHPFTGFDTHDNLPLSDLPRRPYQIVNTAINLTKVNNLAWQERKAASFVLTRQYCGYDLREAGAGKPGEVPEPDAAATRKCGYRPTEDYMRPEDGLNRAQMAVNSLRRKVGMKDLSPRRKAWLSLGQALTISGAAVSPNQGYHSSKAVAFLLTVFNVRLGWWMQNPAKPGAWAKAGPFFGIWYLFKEVFGLASEDTGFVYLSDGGHFENLGIYELVRRRCRFIIAIDSGMDPKFGFEDLGNAVRKCQVDFGVRIDIDTKASMPMQGTGKSLYHCGVGRIHYEEANTDDISGYLLYIKPSLTGNEPVDIMQYASVHPEFPHQSTTDQWFDESQFEAYRKLGYYIATTVLEKQAIEKQPGETSAAGTGKAEERLLVDIFVDLGRRWYRPSARVEMHFTKHAERLMQLQDTMRESEDLAFLDGQIFPEWDYLMKGGTHVLKNSLWLPASEKELRAGFYFCLNLLELMQDVYLDLNLDEEWPHPDNRGWINLFKHFAWSGMLRSTFAVVRSNFGSRFQRFCAVRVELTEGQVEISTPVSRECGLGKALKDWMDKLVESGTLNFEEARLIYRFENPERPGKAAESLKFDALHRIQLVVPGVRREADKGADPNAKELSFPVGVALTSGKTIVFLRIQDHLRNMGLGRDALEKLIRSQDKDGTSYNQLQIEKESPDAERIEYLFYSIKGTRAKRA